MVARFLNLNNPSLTEIAIWIVERRKKVWATGFFLSESSRTGKSYMSFCSAIFAGQRFVEIEKFCNMTMTSLIDLIIRYLTSLHAFKD